MENNAATLVEGQEPIEPTYEQFVAQKEAATQPPAEAETPSAPPLIEESTTAPDSDPRDEESQDDDGKPLTPRQLQRRIDRATKERAEARTEARLYKERLEALEAQMRTPAKPAEKTDSVPAPQPITSENFEGQCKRYGVDPENPAAIGLLAEAIADARADAKIKAAFEDREKQAQDKTRQETTESFFKDFNAKSDEYTKTHPAFPEHRDFVTKKVADRYNVDLFITNSPNPQALIDYLGTHKPEFDQILGLPDYHGIVELGAIAKSLQKPPETKAPQRTQSPPPPAKATGAQGKTEVSEQGSYEDYARKRDAETRRR